MVNQEYEYKMSEESDFEKELEKYIAELSASVSA